MLLLKASDRVEDADGDGAERSAAAVAGATVEGYWRFPVLLDRRDFLLVPAIVAGPVGEVGTHQPSSSE